MTPLFDQLSATAPRIEEGQRELRDLEGRVTGTLALQSAVARRGYKRGDIGDKGVFDTYVKDFASAALTAVLGSPGPVRRATGPAPSRACPSPTRAVRCR